MRRSRSERRASLREGRKLWWRNLWIRAGLLHPGLFVGPWAIAGLITGGDAGWPLTLMTVGVLASVVATIAMAADDEIDQGTRGRVIGLGILTSIVVYVLGVVIWLAAADAACNGRYECPF